MQGILKLQAGGPVGFTAPKKAPTKSEIKKKKEQKSYVKI